MRHRASSDPAKDARPRHATTTPIALPDHGENVIGRNRSKFTELAEAVSVNLSPREHIFENCFAGQYRANRHMTASKRLSEQDHVRLYAPMFDREESSGAAKPRLDFVGDKQGAILSAQA
jgi:hypothetical protein